MSHAASIIHAQGLERIYILGDARVVGLGGIDLDVATGALVVVKGVSGSGKSTLLSLLAGLDRPSAGELTVAGRRLSRFSESELTRYRRETVGMVFQTFNLLPTLSVIENVCLPALLAERSSPEAEKRAADLLDRLGMTHRLHHRPHQLSGGEMQRTAIARALINDPTIVLADEPTGNLDSVNGEAVIALLASLNREEGRTVVIATHSDQADPLGTCFLHLKDGVLLSGPCAV
ncbi:MAG: ABC transporter ATP-binding protein [Desulfobacterales bacterium]